MSATVYTDGFCAFIHAIALKRNELHKWTALIIQVADSTGHADFDEVIQVLNFQFQGQEALILTQSQQKRVFVITRTDRKALSILESSIAKAFPDDNVKVLMGVPLNRGVDILAKMIGMTTPQTDHATHISLKRLARPSNAFLVLTDNKDITAQALRTLQGFGHVTMAQNIEDFFRLYRDYAPNATFIDASFDSAEGESLVSKLRAQYDPHSHVVMIGQAATDAFVNKYKKTGVNGIVIPPLSYDTVLRQLTRVPTKVSRTMAAH